jgi:peptidoglycan/LPS O-acetylase OafA/YrhL
MKYRTDIDGLRTIAVGLVLLFHAHLGVSGGFIGVDVFFVISGFLITRTILDAHEHGRYSILAFYDHRARRILPALVPPLVVTTIAAAFLMLPTDFSAYGQSLAATALFSSNIWFWHSAGYFDTTSATNPLLHTWSLGVEEQFYIFFPLLMTLLFRAAMRWRVAVIGGIAIVSFVLSCAMLERAPEFTFYQLPTRAWELMVGSLISFRGLPQPKPIVAQLCSLAGLVAIMASALTLTETSPFPGAAALPAVIGAAFIIYAGLGGAPTAVGRLLSTPPFRFIGLISYSLYLWHWPLLVFYSYVTGRSPDGAIAAGILAAAVAIAAVSYKFVEQPWRRRSPHIAVAVAPIAGLAAMMAVCAIGLACYRGHGFPQRLSPEVRRIAAVAESRPSFACQVKGPGDVDKDRLCRIGDKSVEPHWLLWGDSHGWALKDAFSIWLEKRHASAWVINSPGCAAISGYSRVGYPTDCNAVGEAALKFLLANGVSDVIDVSAWTNWFSLHTDFVDGQSHERSKAESTAVVTRAFGATIARLHEARVKVWMFDPLPQAKALVPNTLAKDLRFGGDRPLTYSAKEYVDRNADFFRALAANRPNICGHFELERALCSTGTCTVVNADGPLYFDDNHPAAFQTGYFAALLGETMTAQCR